MSKIVAVVVNFNTKDLFDMCILNLLSSWDDLIVIGVDNDSTDGSADFVERKYISNNKVKIIRTKNNGLSAGHNKALSYIKENSINPDYILYLGTDAYPKKEALSNIVKFMNENPNVGVSTPKLVLRDGSLDMDAHRGFMTPWSSLTHWLFLDRLFPNSKLFNQYFLGYKDFTVPHEIDVCISHFMFVRYQTQIKVGLWDEDYFLFGEDIDFCYRVKESSFKIMYLSDIEVLHYKGATIGRKSSKDLKNTVQKSKEVKQILATGRTKAMKLYYQKHLSKKYPFFINIVVYLGIFLLQQLRSFKVKYLG